MAGLPYEILFSCIQKMTVQVPWKSISSNPVVIELDSMLVLVVAKPRQQWEKKGLKDVERLVADLNSFIGGYLNRLIENEKTTAANTTDKKGYLDNVYIRVLDNLQFSVRNIHIRYEDNLNRGYSFGLTLQSI
jgi:vacuolar protein sorting-associated protein 13A/C